ncbi:hypothetical protein ABPG75_008112 [Micractinium tetrahymenae]
MMEGSGGNARRVRKPMYFEEHESASVLLATIRNGHVLLQLPTAQQFCWWHAFFSQVDAVIGQHKVYKLYGGPHGFMLSAGVAEPDSQHAASLLCCALHLRQALQGARLPGGGPAAVAMVLSSGPCSSGLLGAASLTYQIVAQWVHATRELLEGQPHLPLMVTGSMHRELPSSIASGLHLLGSVALQRLGCEEVYTMQGFASCRLVCQPRARVAQPDSAAARDAGGSGCEAAAPVLQPAGSTTGDKAGASAGQSAAAGAAPADQSAGSSDSVDTAPAGQSAGSSGSEGCPNHAKGRAGCGGSKGPAEAAHDLLPTTREGVDRPAGTACPAHATKPEASPAARSDGVTKLRGPARRVLAPAHRARDSPELPADVLLRFASAKQEAAFAHFYNGWRQEGDTLAILLGSLMLATVLLSWHSWRLVLLGCTLQAVPLLGAALSRRRPEAYLRHREALWLLQRLLIPLVGSLWTSPGWGVGPLLCAFAADALLRPVRLHLHLLGMLLAVPLVLPVLQSTQIPPPTLSLLPATDWQDCLPGGLPALPLLALAAVGWRAWRDDAAARARFLAAP